MVEFNQAITDLCECEYPADIDDIKSRCEDNEVTLRNGETTTLGQILDTVREPPEEFQSDTELYNFLMSLAPEESIGRKHYDDRGSNMDNNREQHSI